MNSQAVECAHTAQINPFLSNRLDRDQRQAFLNHLGGCETCSAALRELREDERLARLPLSPREREQLQKIVRQAGRGLETHLVSDTLARVEAVPEPEPVEFAAPSLLTGSSAVLWRALLFAAAAAALLGALLWWWVYS